jgi:hypothetical protein
MHTRAQRALVVTVLLASGLVPASEAPAFTAVVTRDSAAVHGRPSPAAPVLGALERGSTVTVDVVLSGPDGRWCRVAGSDRIPGGFVDCAALDGVATVGAPAAPLEPRRDSASRARIHVVANATLVSVVVNERQRALMIVDTGAAATIITPVIARALGITVPPDAPRRQLTLVGGHRIDVPFVRVATLRVADALVHDLEVGVLDVAPQAPVIDGLLGADFLGRFRVTLDTAARELRFDGQSR